MGIAYTAKGNQIVPVTRRLVIRGRKVRDGRVRIAGAKNSAVALLPATLLADGESVLQNVPDIAAVAVQHDILRELGATGTRTNAGEVQVEASGALTPEVPHPLVNRLGGSALVLAPFGD